MLTCKEVSHLVSESLERKLSFRQRFGMRTHLMMCSLCRTYLKQTLVLRKLVRLYASSVVENTKNDEGLSDEAKKRIKDRIEASTKQRK